MSRLSNALLAALALHGLLLLTHARHRADAPSPALRGPEQLLEIDQSPVGEEPPSPTSASEEVTPSARSASRSSLADAARASSRSPTTATPSADADPGADAPSNDVAAANAAPAGSATAEAAPARKIDFGIDDGFFMRPASEQLPRVPRAPRPAYLRQLDAALSADDVRRGLSRGGALLGSLNAAVRDTGPVRGDALLRVTVGADGGLTAVELLRGSAAQWSSALDAFRALAARKHLRVPPGARGLRVTFSVQSKVQLPSGKAVDSSGVAIAAPSLEPGGLALGGTFDVADIGSGGQRLVYARVVSEEVL
ncbi:MAG TPA: hypothetical protein VGL19_10990 [Polyangiaceae bacterium]